MTKHCPVRHHKNGPYYVARWTAADGTPRSKSLGRCSGRQAEKRCWDIAAEFAVEPGKRDATGAPALGDWRIQYPKLRDDLKASTASLHDKTIRYLIAFTDENVRLDQITHARAEDFKLWLGRKSGRQAETISPQTVASHIRNAKAIFNIAKRRRLIGVNPFDDVSGAAPKVNKQWATITAEQLERIMEACPDGRWRCVFALARLAGLRRGEALRLEWAHVDWERSRLQVWPEGDETTKQRARQVPIAPRLLEILRERWETAREGEQLVCGGLSGDLHRTALSIIRAAGLPEYAKPFHTLRKNLEVEWTRIVPWHVACAWLGHSAKVAIEHYLRAENDEYERVTKREAHKSAQIRTPESVEPNEKPA